MNYQEMTDAELDRLSVGKFGFEWVENNLSDTLWQPTHPDSNQAERYLFPKFTDQKIWVDVCYSRDHSAYVIINCVDLWKVTKTSMNKDQINRTKVIACLYSWDKLNA